MRDGYKIIFDGSSGRRPSAEARRYVYAIVATSLENDMEDSGGWLFGGLESEFDRRRVRKAARLVVTELRRKATT
jgi:hypothetical protein